MLKNAKDSCAAEALEIATYTALARLARTAGDAKTEKLAKSVLADEQKMLDRLLREIPRLTDTVTLAEFDDEGSYDVTETGAADAVRDVSRTAKRTARQGAGQAKRSARQARKVPGVARAEGTVKGAVASESDLAIANYDSLSADEIQDKLTELSQIDLAKLNAYERKNQNRSTITSRIDSLQADEPWPGYDELRRGRNPRRALRGRRHTRQGRPQLRAQAQEPRRRNPGDRARTQQRVTEEPQADDRGGPNRPPLLCLRSKRPRTRGPACAAEIAPVQDSRERSGWLGDESRLLLWTRSSTPALHGYEQLVRQCSPSTDAAARRRPTRTPGTVATRPERRPGRNGWGRPHP